VDEGLSLLSLLKQPGFEAALVTTFNVYLPFFEEVVHRRLLSAGCRHIVLAADAHQLGEAMCDPYQVPHLAGRSYVLAPMTARGAFHPKILMLLGPKTGRLFVGSHNVTVSGLGLNAEVTNQIELDDPKDRQGAQNFRDAIQFVLAWSADQPVEIQEAIRSMSDFAPWLRGPVIAEGPDQFLGSQPDGPSLWERLRPLLPTEIERVSLVGPFFDSKLQFLRQLLRDTGARELFVGVDPDRGLGARCR
jgi:hypothetical protein